MIRALWIAACCIAAATLGGVRAEAQYMFLDFDGDGQYTYSDGFGGRDTTNVDLYVDTGRNEDGSPASCNGNLFAYTVNLMAYADSVTFVSVVNQMPDMFEMAPVAKYPHALFASFGSYSSFPPGKYRLLSMRVVFSGCSNLEIVSSSCYTPDGMPTSIGTSCADEMLPVFGKGAWGCTDIPLSWPTAFAPEMVAATVGQPISFIVRAGAAGCYLHSFYGYDLPPGASLSALSPIRYGYGEATFQWTPQPGQAGTWPVHFEAYNPDPFNMRDMRATVTTTITVSPASPANEVPQAVSGGPYRSVQGVPLFFDGSWSTDPEGAPLTYEWHFGDGTTAAGPKPLHTYVSGGVFTVVLRVTDPDGLSDDDSTTATIARDIPVRVFTTPSNDPTHLGRGKQQTCFQVEGADASFSPEQIVPSSVYLEITDPVCGDVEAYSSGTKTATVEDADKNGIPDYSACFSRDAMQTLGACLPQGTQTVHLRLFGALATGERIHGEVDHTFVSKGALQIAVTPNPITAASSLQFVTRREGNVTARLFDIRGRLVATLYQQRHDAPGRHEISFESIGPRLASGVYFVRVRAEGEAEETRRVTVLR